MKLTPIVMYKLTSPRNETHGGMTWRIGQKNTAKGTGNKMCTDQLLHCYSDPRLAVIFNPMHAAYQNPNLYKIECSEILATDGLKYGCKEQTPIEKLELPKISTTQLVAFAIKCALLVYQESSFVQWANGWLDNKTPTARTYAAAYAAYAYATGATAFAAHVAIYAAYAYATGATAFAAHAADYAAHAAAGKIDFVSIIDWVQANITE